MHTLPNGDVLTAEAMFTPGGIKTPFDLAMYSTMKRAADKATATPASSTAARLARFR